MKNWRIRSTTRRVAALAALATFVAPWSGSVAATPDEPDDEPVESSIDEPSLAEEGQFAVQPSGPNGPTGRDHFVYTMKTGQVLGDIVSISNLGDETATFAIYPSDAFNTNDGSFTILREEEEPTGVGSWIELGADQYTLEPGTRVDIPFKIEVPDDMTPGDHAGAIVAQRVPETGTEEPGVSLDVRLRIGARVYVRVEGLLSPSLVVEDFRLDYDQPTNPFGTADAKIFYTVRNTGNVRLSPTANTELSGIFGLGSKTLPERQIPELLPGSSLQIAETVQDVRPLVRLTADLEIEDEREELTVNSSVTQWTIPWLLVIVIALVIAGLLVWRWWSRRPEPEPAADTDAKDETEAGVS